MLLNDKESVMNMVYAAIARIENQEKERMRVIWLETSECFGEIISLLDAKDPDILYWLTKMVDVTFYNSIMYESGEVGYESIIETVESGKPYMLVISGAIPLAADGHCTIIANYQGRYITAKEATEYAASNATHVIAAGICACYGGITAARPNVSEAVSVKEFLKREVILAPGCPVHPMWVLSVFSYLVNFDSIPLDKEGRPITIYGENIHEHCPRRAYFEQGIFARKFGDHECMFLLGCRGPRTNTLCPFTRWNESNNWPIGVNTNCIGCATNRFPDGMEPFVTYERGERNREDSNSSRSNQQS